MSNSLWQCFQKISTYWSRKKKTTKNWHCCAEEPRSCTWTSSDWWQVQDSSLKLRSVGGGGATQRLRDSDVNRNGHLQSHSIVTRGWSAITRQSWRRTWVLHGYQKALRPMNWTMWSQHEKWSSQLQQLLQNKAPGVWVTEFIHCKPNAATVLPSSSSFVHGVKGSSDDESANFARAGADFVQLGVPEESAHGVVVDVAVPTCRRVTQQIGCVVTAGLKDDSDLRKMEELEDKW